MSQEQDPQNKEVKVNVEEKKMSEVSFFRKVLISIKDFDKYPELATQTMVKVMGYIVILIALTTLVTGIFFSVSMYQKAEKAIHYFEQEIPELSYEDKKLTMPQDEPIKIENGDDLVEMIFIDTRSDLSKETYQQYEKELGNRTTALLFLQDKVMIKIEGQSNLISYSYQDIASIYQVDKLSKQDIIDAFSGQNLILLCVGIFITYFIYTFMINIIATLMYAITLGLAGYVTALVLRLRLRFSAMYKMAIHSLTLPTILLALYTVVNLFTGFTIQYFDVMYIAVAYIYLIAALFIIKSDVVKRQQELSLIIEEQARLAAEKQAQKEREEQEKREQEEKERRKKRDEEKKKKEEQENKKEKEEGEPQTGNA